MMRCRGADSRARRNAADPNRLSPKRHRPPELSLRGPKGAAAISGRHCRLVPAAVKTEPVPTGLVAALTAQPSAALPPYGCGVPLAGSERLAGWQYLLAQIHWRNASKFVIARRPKADVAP